MKKKILLLVSLVLLAVQGWATPVDSLEILNTGNRIHGGLSELSIGDVVLSQEDLNPFNPIDIYEMIEWRSGVEFMQFSWGHRGCLDKVLLGVDTVLYLRAFQGYLESPLTIEMIEGDGAFNFHKEMIYPKDMTILDSTMYPEHYPSKWCGKTMRIGFHPSEAREYRARFRIKGTSGVEKEFILKCKVVEELRDRTIYISPSTISPFSCEVGKTDTKQFKVIAKNLTTPLIVTIEDDLDLISDMGIAPPFRNDRQCGGRFSFSFVGSNEVNQPTLGKCEKTTISPEEADQGAILTIKYDPRVEGGYHQAKAVIRGDGFSARIRLRGHSSIGKINVSQSTLRFPNYNYDHTNPFEGLYTQSFMVTGNGLTDDSVYVNLNDERFSIVGYDSFSAKEVEQGVTVWVRYNPNGGDINTADISISGGGVIESKTVHLIGTSVFPEITVDEESLTFSDAAVGMPVSKHFRVTGTNLTDDLYLTKDESDGNQFSINKEKITVDEAANGVNVTITYTPTSAGTHSGRVSITGGGAEKKTIYLSGNAIDPPHVAINRPSVSFSDIVVGDYDTETFTVTGWNLTSNLELSLTGASVFSINKFIISPDQNGSANATITVTYRPIATGSQTAKVIISGGGLNETKTVNLMGTSVVREIKATPAALTFSKITVGNPDSKHFIVTATNPNAPLTLKLNDNTGMFSIKDDKTIITTEEAANGAEVTVIYKPTEVGSHDASISITGGGALEEKIVSLIGSAVPAPPTVTPSSLTFNDVVVGGDPKTDEFIVKGSDFTSNLNLTLTGATGVFSINKTVITPAQAASGQTIKVTYKPTSEGTQTAKVTISGGGTNETKIVNLTGNAVVRKITTDKSALTFTSQTVGKSVSKTFKITGTNLTGAVTVKLNDKTGMFTIDRTTAATGATVTVTYKPTAAGSHVASITLYGGGAPEEKIVSLSGSAVVRKITTSDLNVTFYNTPVNQAVTKNLTVSGTNLTGQLTVKLSDGTGMYSITPTTLPASGGTVKVTYKPTSKGSHTAKITISGGDALESVTVNLKGTAVVPSISVSPSSLSFTQGDASKSFTVTGSYLTGNLSLSLSGSSIFILGKSSITASQAANGVSVSVGCIPKNVTSASGTITISGGGASQKTVTLSYRKSDSGGVVSINAVEPDGENDGEENNNEFTNGGFVDAFMNATTDVNELAMNSKIYAEGLNIIIESPVDQSAIISDISGRAWRVDLQNGRNEIPVNANGVYIVRIREKTTKLMLK